MPDFYLSVGLVDENFINETLPVLRRDPIKLRGPVSEGVAERGLEGSKPRKGLLKEALEAQNLEGVVERCLEGSKPWKGLLKEALQPPKTGPILYTTEKCSKRIVFDTIP